MKKVLTIFVLASLLFINSGYAETNGKIKFGGSYNDQIKVENIYFDGQLDIRDKNLETIINYDFIKNQTKDNLQSLNSEAELQENFFLNKSIGYFYALGKQERHKMRRKNYDVTFIGGGIGVKEDNPKLIIPEYFAQIGLVANSEYDDEYFDRDVLLMPEFYVEIPLIYNLSFENENETKVNLDYMKDWDMENEANLMTDINENVSVGLTWILNYENAPNAENAVRHENIYMVSVKSEF